MGDRSEVVPVESSWLTVDFKLLGDGWADLDLWWDGGSTRIKWCSDLGDGLGDMLVAGLLLSFGDVRSLMFEHEPGTTHIDFHTDWSRERQGWFVRLTIAEGREGLGREDPMPPRRPLHDIILPEAIIEAAFLAAGEAILAVHGVEGYRNQWGGAGFPNRELLALRAALSEERIRHRDE